MKKIDRLSAVMFAAMGCYVSACGPDRTTDAAVDSAVDARTDARDSGTADVRDVTTTDAQDAAPIDVPADTQTGTDAMDTPAAMDAQDVMPATDVVDVSSAMDVMDVATIDAGTDASRADVRDVMITVDTGPERDAGMGPRVMVVRVGDGVNPLGTGSSPVFLDEYSLTGVRARSISLPQSGSGANYPLTISGTSSSEGALSRSTDGHYVVLAGYGAAPFTAGIAGTAAASTPRVVARVDAAGMVDTSTALTNAYDMTSVRGAATGDGSAFWVGGTGNTTTGGAYYATLGATMGTAIAAMPPSERVINIFGGQLYASSGSGAFATVFTIGTGTPTTAGQTATALPGVPTATGTYGFALVTAAESGFASDVLYVADDAATGGGIHKYTFNPTTSMWVASLSATGLAGGTRGLAAFVTTAGTVTLAATTSATSMNSLVSCTDVSALTAPVCTTVTSATMNTIFRGVALAPQ